ncbi:hypothetical protein C8R46DRAFT_1006654 [Mycena filopes]|nr:hypothetical protein C8R46DRAFT_1006654 [Mycena filopes]
MLSSFLIVAASAAMAQAAADPCTVASASDWVSGKAAHACEVNVPFNKTRSLAVIDSNIKALPWYSLETWFQHSPNPLIPHDVNISSLLHAVQKKTAGAGYKSDWDFNVAVTDAWNHEADGHTLFAASCTESFSYNLPFSIATLASSPTSLIAYPTFLVNYDFPNQNRAGLEAYYKGLGLDVRPSDGARILTINGVEAGIFLVALATESSIYDGLVGAYETVNPRYMRLMSRYSADTASGAFTQEVGRFGQRAFYPGADSVSVVVETAKGPKSLTVPWAATFVGSGNTTASFIAETCLPAADAALKTKREVERRAGQLPAHITRQKAVVRPDNQGPIRASGASSLAPQANYAQPNLTSFGHITTLDVYQLASHPEVGVLYFEQFEPSDGTDFETYVLGMGATIFTGITKLKEAGVKHILIDNSGNRGGYIFAGAVALWSLFPTDLYPGFPAVLRDGELARQESVAAAAGDGDFNSEYYYGFYRDLEYNLLKNDSQFMDPPVPKKVNGIADAYSQPFFDDFGLASDVTNFTAPAFDGIDYVIVANSICASTCSVFSSYLYQKHNVRSAVFGGTPVALTSQFDGGVKGSEVTDFSSVLGELSLAGLSDAPNAPQPFPINADLTMNFRNAIPYIDQQDGILEYVYEAGTKKYQFTKEMFNKPQEVWEFVAEEFFGKN